MRDRRALLATSLLVVSALHSAALAQEPPKPDDAAWRKVIEPSRVTVKFENTPLDEAWKKLSELTGNLLLISKGDPRDAKKVTMEFKDEPFWKVAGALEAQLGARLDAGIEAMAYRVGNGSPLDPAWTVFLGPARLQLARSCFRREAHFPFWFGVQGTLQSYLEFEVAVEPRVTATAGSLQLTELTDDTGRNLLAAEMDGRGRKGFTDGWGRYHGQIVASGFMSMPIAAPAPEATKIRSLKGRLELSLSATTLPRAVFVEKLDAATPWAGTTFSGKLAREGEHVTVQVTTGPAKSPAEVRALLPQVRLLGSDDGIRSGGVELPKTLPDGSVQARLSFWMKENVEARALLLPEIAPPRPQAYDFELHDIPLPPLKAFYTKLAAAEAVQPPERPVPPAPEGFHPLSELRGSTFTLKADNMSLSEVAAEITRQTGNRLDAPGETPTYLKQNALQPHRISGNWENVEFWPGIAAICRTAGVGFARSTDPAKSAYSLWRAQQRAGPAEVTSLFRIVGPLRLNVECNLVAESRLFYWVKPNAADALTLEVRIAGDEEPACILQSYGASVEQCITSAGRDLLQRLPPARAPRAPGTGRARPADPRCTGVYSVAYPSSLYINLPVPMRPSDAAKRIALLRLYCAFETFEDPNRVEIADATKPSTHNLPDGLTIQWLGLDDRRRLCYRGERQGGLTEQDKEMLSLPRVAIVDTHGERMRFNGWGRTGDGTNYVSLRPGQTPAKVLICLHPKIYAGIVEFRDIPLPVLPEVP